MLPIYMVRSINRSIKRCLYEKRDKKPNWSQYYSGSKEIHEYFDDIAERYDLKKYVKFMHRIVNAEWLEKEGKWKITVMRNGDPKDTFDDYADFFLHGGGVLK